MPSGITKFGSLKGSNEHLEDDDGRFGLESTEYYNGLAAPPGEHYYYNPGSYTWVCPAGVFSICVVCIGGGGGGFQFDFMGVPFAVQGGGGGTLAYKNNFTVVPGQGYDLVVGAGGTGATQPSGALPSNTGGSGGQSFFNNTTTCQAGGGDGGRSAYFSSNQTQSSAPVGDGGGRGGFNEGFAQAHPLGGGRAGGGGAGGYSGNGGGFSWASGGVHVNPTGGAGFQGAVGAFMVGGNSGANSGPGGGVGPYGEGASGSAYGESGSNGRNAGLAAPSTANKAIVGGTPTWDPSSPSMSTLPTTPHNSAAQTNAGIHGGGGGNNGEGPVRQVSYGSPALYIDTGVVGNGGNGAVRIIWGLGRAFPATNCSDSYSVTVQEN